ncbi:MAG: hypothetical protein HQ477_11505 [Chloroflexi bacterium]|nr:hypothetical protein [Chloroflexota bacterium]
MYVLRRVYEVKPGMARRYATIAMKQCEEYEKAGQRSPARIYYNGGTVPGDKNRVYMEWTADVIDSPSREGNVIPQSVRDAGAAGRDMVIESWIEFYELMTPGKADNG